MRDRQPFIDLDGVLADFDGYFETVFGYRNDKDNPALHTPEAQKDFWAKLASKPTFYADLPVMPDALELWEGMKELHPNPIILTGIPKSIHDVSEQKRQWVARHIDPSAQVITCFSAHKRHHAKPGDLLIDDWIKYRHLWEEMGGIFILHTSAATSLKEAARHLLRSDV